MHSTAVVDMFMNFKRQQGLNVAGAYHRRCYDFWLVVLGLFD